MHRSRIKICGINKPAPAITAVNAGADYIGLVFVEKSPRCVTLEQAKAIVDALPEDSAEVVGLFVDRDPQEIKLIAKKARLSVVQLHGHEPITILDKLEGLTVWKALPFDEDLIERAKPWDDDPRVDAILIDTPPTGGLTGGSGVAFDWSALAKRVNELSTPVILAGGLNPANVAEAIRTVKPDIVDVSSGVESSRGVKNVGLIKAFCEAVRQADSD